MAYQQFANSLNPATTLSGNGGTISAGATTLKVASVANLPANPNFTIGISTSSVIEWMLVTAINAGTLTLTVTRAQEGSTGATHADGDNIYLVLTAQVLKNMLSDTLNYGTYASRPTSTTGARTGMTYRCSDSPYEYVFNGSAWVARVFGFEVTEPVLANFTQVNVDKSTFDSTHGGLIQSMAGQASSEHTQVLVQAIPGSGAYYVDAAFTVNIFMGNQGGVGVGISDGTLISSKSAFAGFGRESGNWNILQKQYNSTTSWNGNNQIKDVEMVGPLVWVRFYDDRTTNRTWYFSPNGYTWYQHYQQTRTTFLTPAQCGLYCVPYNMDIYVHWLHFSIHT